MFKKSKKSKRRGAGKLRLPLNAGKPGGPMKDKRRKAKEKILKKELSDETK